MSRKSLLVIGYHWPEPDATAAGVRMLQLLIFFLDHNYQITFASTPPENEHAQDLKNLGIATVQIRLNCPSFDAFISELKPVVVVFDRFLTEEQFGWRVAEQMPQALRILDTEDLHSLRHVRKEAFKKGIPFTTVAWLQDDKTKREVASIYRSDISLIISSFEMKLLQEVVRMDENLLLHLPFMVDEKDTLPELPTFEKRSDFIFIGGGKHVPNVDAIVHLKQHIWPKIRIDLPDVNLHIYGAYLPQRINEMHNPKTGFYVQGRAEAVKEVMLASRVCLAPLRFGAGIKGKLLHAMQYGTPSVTTTIGAEGMHANLSWNGTIADDVTDFAKAAVQLYSDKNSWMKAQEQGIKILKNIYSRTALDKVLQTKIKTVQNNISEHRKQNFIGSLLQHQTMTSTKYMGKRIEEKNKK